VHIPSNELDQNLNNLVRIILGIFLNKLARTVACVLPGYKIAVSHYRCTNSTAIFPRCTNKPGEFWANRSNMGEVFEFWCNWAM